MADTSVPASSDAPPTRARHYQIDRLLRRLLSGTTTPLIVEIGCGYGDVGILVSKWARFIGYEPSESLQAIAKSRGLDARQEHYSGDKLNEAPDAIVIDNVLEHVHEPNAIVSEAAKSLRRGGVLIVIVPNLHDVRQLHPKWRRNRLWALPEHINYFSTRTLRDLMERNGLTCRPFGLSVIRNSKDLKFVPRALLEECGVSLFGHNIYAKKS